MVPRKFPIPGKVLMSSRPTRRSGSEWDPGSPLTGVVSFPTEGGLVADAPEATCCEADKEDPAGFEVEEGSLGARDEEVKKEEKGAEYLLICCAKLTVPRGEGLGAFLSGIEGWPPFRPCVQ